MAQPSAAEGSHVGRVLAGRYRLVRLVGTGGMGSVYEAIHVHTDKRVAIKLLAPGLSKDLKLVARFRREAMAASRLEQENCVHVDDFGEDADGTFFIVMEFIEGHGLADELRKTGPMAPDRVALLAVQLLKALDTAHAAGVLHRDLKPQNVMLTQKPGRGDIVKVVDFGIAKITTNSAEDQGALTVPGTIFGTPEYMSPEQARGETLDARSDLYSASVVLWHMLIGRSPFRGASVRETLLKVFSEQAPAPPPERATGAVPAGLEAALRKAMSKHKEERFPDAASFLEAIAPFVAEQVQDLPRRALPGLPADGSAPPTTLDDQRSPTRPVLETELAPLAGRSGEKTAVDPNATLVMPEAPTRAPSAMPVKGVPAGTPLDAGTRVLTLDAVANQGQETPVASASSAPAPLPTAPERRGARISRAGVAVLVAASAVLLACAIGVALVARTLLSRASVESVEEPTTPPTAPSPVPPSVVPSAPAEGLLAVIPAPLDPRVRDAALARAEAALAAEDVVGAAAAFQEAYRADPASAKAMQGIASTAMRLKDHRLAATFLEKLMAQDEKSRRAFAPLYARERQLADGSGGP